MHKEEYNAAKISIAQLCSREDWYACFNLKWGTYTMRLHLIKNDGFWQIILIKHMWWAGHYFEISDPPYYLHIIVVTDPCLTYCFYYNLAVSKIILHNKRKKGKQIVNKEMKIVSYLLPRRKRPLLRVILSLKPSSLYRWSLSWVCKRKCQ